ncbi:hypothetical protein EDD11_000213 [Mortierella claussenii]|nr:hypothetical protein EDD11_000213 [Mortierella claussenii]
MDPLNDGHQQQPSSLQPGIRSERALQDRGRHRFTSRADHDDDLDMSAGAPFGDHSGHDQRRDQEYEDELEFQREHDFHHAQLHVHDHSGHDHHSHGGHSHDHGGRHDGENAEEGEEDVHEEALHFHKIIKAFSHYKASAMYANHRRRTDFYSLPERQQKLLPKYLKRMEKIDEAIEANYEIIKIICEDQQIFVNDDRPMAKLNLNDKPRNAVALRVRQQDMEKVQGTIKQFVRDWSAGGKPEREAIYDPMVRELKSRFSHIPTESRGSINVLVPGSGLGRLAFDIAHEGFSAQGNEFSYYMLLASNFILNKAKAVDQFLIYPYIHSFSNIVNPDDVLTEARIPDTNPSAIPRGTDFSMVAGDFLEVYGQEQENFGKWDAVVTCFFIDTAKNIVNYLETIHKILKKDGVWINAGPLLWHFENTANEISIELSLEEVVELAKTIGFRFEAQGTSKSTYMANPHGMLKYVYECATWTAVKI